MTITHTNLMTFAPSEHSVFAQSVRCALREYTGHTFLSANSKYCLAFYSVTWCNGNQVAFCHTVTQFVFFFLSFSRMSVQLFRDRSSYLSRIFLLSLFVPFICLFLGRLKNTQTGVQDRIGLMYQSSQVPPYVAILNAVALCKL